MITSNLRNPFPGTLTVPRMTILPLIIEKQKTKNGKKGIRHTTAG
jgi:hypothetical protein